jgi:Asp-tRNA(Asn)/Glu-tRNA(Gln) amidotransferase A subunit family amidase
MKEDISRRRFVGAMAATAATAAVGSSAAATPLDEASPWDELDRLDATGVAEWVRGGKVTPRELLDRSIKRIDRLNPIINAVTLRHDDLAWRSLETLDRSAPFAGVPFLLKDLWVAMAGTEVTNGSRFFQGTQYDHDGELVSRFRRAGFVILGKTASPELGLTTTTESALHGAVKNPWRLDRTAGGSSGGAAAAVSAGMVPIAHASDGGGSIRIPASCCGLVGLKTSRGRVPFPIRRYQGWGGLSTHFAVTRSVRDAARLLDAVAGPESGAPVLQAPPQGSFASAITKAPRTLRIARLPAPLSGGAVDPECERAVDVVVEICRKQGHRVEVAMPQIDYKAYTAAFGTIIAVQTLAAIRDREQQLARTCNPGDVELVTWYIAQSGKKVDGLAFAAAESALDLAARQSAAFMEQWDLTLSPTLAQAPVSLGKLGLSPTDFAQYAADVTAFSPFTSLANVTGQPSISVPVALSTDGLPLGAMFTGRYADESTLLALAEQIERELSWQSRRPRFIA